jgi:hypothetical protein
VGKEEGWLSFDQRARRPLSPQISSLQYILAHFSDCTPKASRRRGSDVLERVEAMVRHKGLQGRTASANAIKSLQITSRCEGKEEGQQTVLIKGERAGECVGEVWEGRLGIRKVE